jgi:hypothetical protein
MLGYKLEMVFICKEKKGQKEGSMDDTLSLWSQDYDTMYTIIRVFHSRIRNMTHFRHSN